MAQVLFYVVRSIIWKRSQFDFIPKIDRELYYLHNLQENENKKNKNKSKE